MVSGSSFQALVRGSNTWAVLGIQIVGQALGYSNLVALLPLLGSRTPASADSLPPEKRGKTWFKKFNTYHIYFAIKCCDSTLHPDVWMS